MEPSGACRLPRVKDSTCPNGFPSPAASPELCSSPHSLLTGSPSASTTSRPSAPHKALKASHSQSSVPGHRGCPRTGRTQSAFGGEGPPVPRHAVLRDQAGSFPDHDLTDPTLTPGGRDAQLGFVGGGTEDKESMTCRHVTKANLGRSSWSGKAPARSGQEAWWGGQGAVGVGVGASSFPEGCS